MVIFFACWLVNPEQLNIADGAESLTGPGFHAPECDMGSTALASEFCTFTMVACAWYVMALSYHVARNCRRPSKSTSDFDPIHESYLSIFNDFHPRFHSGMSIDYIARLLALFLEHHLGRQTF